MPKMPKVPKRRKIQNLNPNIFSMGRCVFFLCVSQQIFFASNTVINSGRSLPLASSPPWISVSTFGILAHFRHFWH
jgi:hypothetical protein